MLIDRRALLVFCGAIIAAPTALAQDFPRQDFPSRSLHMVVPYPAGGGTDFFARLVAVPMGEMLGQQIIVDNRPGGGTNLGAEVVARAKSDGHTFLLGDNAIYAVNRSLYTHLNYNTERDFAPVSLTGRFAIVLLVNTNKLHVSSVKELIEAAKKTPAKIDYASAGVGSPFHLAGEMFAQGAGIKLNHVPYRGAALAIKDLVGGQIGMMFVDFATAHAQLDQQHIKAIAVASPGEFYGLPGVPPVAKDVPGFEAWAWQGFALPSNTPRAYLNKLRDAYLNAIGRPDIRDKLIKAGIDPLQSTPEEMAAHMKREASKWEKVIKTANIKVE